MAGISGVEGLNALWPRLGPIQVNDAVEKLAGAGLDAASPAGKAGEGSFAESLRTALSEVNALQIKADNASRGLALGLANIDEVAIAGQKAEIALRLTLAVRNKVMDAYNEIMRMQI